MPDFLPNARGLTIAEIVALTHAEPRPGISLDARISDIAPLDFSASVRHQFFGSS